MKTGDDTKEIGRIKVVWEEEQKLRGDGGVLKKQRICEAVFQGAIPF